MCLEPRELERVVVVPEPDPVSGESRGEAVEFRGESTDVVGRHPVRIGHPRNDDARGTDRRHPVDRRIRVRAKAIDALVGRDDGQPRRVKQPGEDGRGEFGQSGDLDGAIAGLGHGAQCGGKVVGGPVADRVQLEGDLVGMHPRTIGHRVDFGCRSLRG